MDFMPEIKRLNWNREGIEKVPEKILPILIIQPDIGQMLFLRIYLGIPREITLRIIHVFISEIQSIKNFVWILLRVSLQ